MPTNGWYTQKTIDHLKRILEEPDLFLFAVELSLDGTAEFHDRFRGAAGSFEHAMVTYDALAKLQQEDPRLRIHSISTATNVNIGEIRQLTEYLLTRCPQMDHHNLALIRGDRKDPALITPDLQEYADLYAFIRDRWQPREEGRYGAIVEPMLQWAKLETLKRGTQIVPCRAGVLTAVVTARGDVSVCELHEPLGNLRDQSFTEIWSSPRARALRESIAAKACHCTTEVFLWPSIVYQPLPLLKTMRNTYAWSKAERRRAAEQTSRQP